LYSESQWQQQPTPPINRITNPNFVPGDNGYPWGWVVYCNSSVSLKPEDDHTTALCINNTGNGSCGVVQDVQINTFLSQIDWIRIKYTYKVEMSLNLTIIDLKVNYYDTDGNYKWVEEYSIEHRKFSFGKWMNDSFTFVPPQYTVKDIVSLTSIEVGLILNDPGEIFFDDVILEIN